MKKILVLEDEANIRSFVVINLNRAGYETIEDSHFGVNLSLAIAFLISVSS